MVIIILLVAYPIFFISTVGGGVFGIPKSDASEWGGLLQHLHSFVGIVLALPLGILLALGRRSKMPVVRSLVYLYRILARHPLITILFMAQLLPLFFPSGVEFDKVVRAMIGINYFNLLILLKLSGEGCKLHR